MIIYNVTINLENEVLHLWQKWIKTHINKVLQTGKFEKAILSKVLSSDEGHTYSVQYYAKNRQALNDYYNKFSKDLKVDTFKTFGNQIIAFRTELEIIEEFTM